MDVLTDVLAGIRIGRAEACSVRQSGAWGWRYAAFAGSGFHLVMQGEAWLITRTARPRRLSAGDVVFTPWGAEHGLSHAPAELSSLPRAVQKEDLPQPASTDVEFLCGAYWLDHGPVPPYLRSLPDVIAVSPDHEGSPQMRPLMELVRAGLADAGPTSEITRPALLDLVLTNLLRQWVDENRDALPSWAGDPVIVRVLERMDEEPDRSWTLSDLSALAGMSKTAFSQRFSSAVGESPMRYLTGQRLAQAARLLRETDLPLAAIARRVGYSTEFALSGAFRREYGIAPGRFRSR